MQILSVIKRHGYRLEDVATMLGITKGSLSATINGSPNVKKLIDIALIIGCSPAEFFDDWYENEGKEQKRQTNSLTPDPSPRRGEEEEQQEQKQDLMEFLPFVGKPEEKPALTPAAAILCPYCGKAITIGVVK